MIKCDHSGFKEICVYDEKVKYVSDTVGTTDKWSEMQ